MKENNLRIKAQDTSTSASFPTNDWQITFNDSSNGGANKFSIDDIDGGRTPFTLEAGAPSNSLYVDDGGRIGLGTNTPVVELHTVNGDTPTLRLEQSGSSGFTPQTWDVAGNETNFFIRDATNGSTLPFRIRPGAPTSSIHIGDSGNVGLGTSSPSAALHILDGDETFDLVVQETSVTGPTVVLRRDAGTPADWHWRVGSSGNINLQNNLIPTTREFQFFLDGRASFAGELTVPSCVGCNVPSDVNRKRNFASIDSADVLDAVSELEIRSWSYRFDDPSVRHIGPTAQDFYAAFDVGDNDTTIHPADMNGVALAAIQALEAQNADLQTQITDLETQLEELLSRVEDQ